LSSELTIVLTLTPICIFKEYYHSHGPSPGFSHQNELSIEHDSNGKINPQ